MLKLLENPATYHLYILLNPNHIELFADKLPISLSQMCLHEINP